jgi:DNA-binding transcriptional LysR family regulator
MTLEQLRVLVKVVQAGSFTKAAENLGTQKSYVSRVISQLESELGVKLLMRNTRNLSVTEVGREVLARAISVVDTVEDTERLAQDSQGEPRGVLKLSCGVEFGMLMVGRWIEDYLATYPEVSAEVEYSGRVVDLVYEGFDLAIRLGPLNESRLVARELGQLEYGLFACTRYLQASGAPQTPEELRRHPLVMFSGGSHRRGWQLIHADGMQVPPEHIEGPARLLANNSFAVRGARCAAGQPGHRRAAAGDGGRMGGGRSADGGDASLAPVAGGGARGLPEQPLPQPQGARTDRPGGAALRPGPCIGPQPRLARLPGTKRLNGPQAAKAMASGSARGWVAQRLALNS